MKKYKRIFGHVKHFAIKTRENNISAIAGQSAFFIILSIMPFFMFCFAILSFFNVPKDFFTKYIVITLPKSISNFISVLIDDSYKQAVGVAFTTIIVALWSSGKGAYSVSEGVCRIHGVNTKRRWLHKRVVAMGYTLILFLVITVMFLMVFVTEFLQHLIEPLLKTAPKIIIVLYGLRYVLLFVFMIIMIALALKLILYHNIGDKKQCRLKLQLPGAILTAVVWIIMSQGISLYVTYFGGFSIYGSITSIIIIMVWIYYSMLIFLYSVQINYIYRHKFERFNIKNLFRKKTKGAK